MNRVVSLHEGLVAGGAPRMWARAVRESLPVIRAAVPPGSRVLEVGYGDGLLSCFLAAELGWLMTGLDIRSKSAEQARTAARACGLEDRLDFRVVRPEETRRHAGCYRAVFVKTVFYSSRTLDEYREWLDWVLSVLEPGGALVNFETGRANGLTQAYRTLRGREYTDLSLYTGEVERLYDERFAVGYRRYYGGMSQFLAPMPGVYEAAAALEESLSRRSADNCFLVSLVGQARREMAKADVR